MKKVIIIIAIFSIVLMATLYGTGVIGGGKDKDPGGGDGGDGGNGAGGTDDGGSDSAGVSDKIKSIYESIQKSFSWNGDNEEAVYNAIKKISSRSEYSKLEKYYKDSSGDNLESMLKSELTPVVSTPWISFGGTDYYAKVQSHLKTLS